MSYWGAQVIVNLFSTVPFIGEGLGVWIRGDYTISDITLNRFFAFHVIAFPLVLLALVAAHLMALHEVGSNNPDGIEIKQQPKDPVTGLPLDGIYSHPYYTIKDIVGVVFFLAVFSIIVFFCPGDGRLLPRSQQFHPGQSAADAGAHRAGVVFHPYYSILRGVPLAVRLAVPGRGGDGRVGDGAVLPALARPQPGEVDPLPRRALQVVAGSFVVAFVVLGYLGVMPMTVSGQFPDSWPILGSADKATVVARVFTVVYFLFFLLMPWYTARDKTKPVPERTT